MISGDRGGQGVGPSLPKSSCLEMLQLKPDEHVSLTVEVRHLVGKLSTTETLLRCNVNFPCYKCL